MINNFILQGRFVKDLDLRYTSSGKAVASSTVASQRNFKNGNGEYESDFIPVVIWGKTAETIANHFKKGNEILLVGRIQTRNYENEQGQKIYITEMVVESFSFTSGNRDNNQNNQQNNQSFHQESMPGMDKRGFNKDSDPFGQSSQIDISDDDLPF